MNSISEYILSDTLTWGEANSVALAGDYLLSQREDKNWFNPHAHGFYSNVTYGTVDISRGLVGTIQGLARRNWRHAAANTLLLSKGLLHVGNGLLHCCNIKFKSNPYFRDRECYPWIQAWVAVEDVALGLFGIGHGLRCIKEGIQLRKPQEKIAWNQVLLGSLCIGIGMLRTYTGISSLRAKSFDPTHEFDSYDALLLKNENQIKDIMNKKGCFDVTPPEFYENERISIHKFSITAFERSCPHPQDVKLYDQAEGLHKLDNSGSQPLMLALFSTNDPNGAFDERMTNRRTLRPFMSKFQVRRREIDSSQEICHQIKEVSVREGRPIDNLIIGAHGVPNVMAFANHEYLTTQTSFPKNCFDGLAPKAEVILASCSTGASRLFGLTNVAQHIADITQKKVIAPTTDVSMTSLKLKFDHNDSVPKIEFWEENQNCTATLLPREDGRQRTIGDGLTSLVDTLLLKLISLNINEN